jgi:pentatricopeptide repeat protein
MYVVRCAPHMTIPQAPASIKHHAIIGDLHTVALVDLYGTIDFMCMPRIDGPSVFATLLEPKGGCFSVGMKGVGHTFRQMYLPDTNVLMTRILCAEQIVEITDFMVIGQGVTAPILIRQIRAVRGTPHVTVKCKPAFRYASVAHDIVMEKDEIQFRPRNEDHALHLISDLALSTGRDKSASVRFTLGLDQSHYFVLGVPCKQLPKRSRDVTTFAEQQLADTTRYWKDWAGKSTYRGRYREAVMRSALVLKLLVSLDYGSIAAAATFGLPEASHGERNWDYRFCWVRDSSFTVYAFIRLGYVDEARGFMNWLSHCVLPNQSEDQPLQPLYRMDGSRDLPEIELKHFAGFDGAKPVRIGNGAHDQLQLDIYGAVLDAAYLTSKYGGAISVQAWKTVTKVIDWVCEHWRQPDEGIWEVRNGRSVLLHSRVMCWVAVDRATRLAVKRSLPAEIPRWNAARAEIYNSIIEDFWNEELQAFTRTPDGPELDASALMMPLVRFIGAKDPQWRSTQQLIQDTLSQDGLVYRYTPSIESDGLDGHEGAFTTCSFWLVECLARQGRTDDAHLLFEKIMDYGNHVGLFAEEIGPGGEHMGNFPQALTHLSLISAAIALDREMSNKGSTTWQ